MGGSSTGGGSSLSFEEVTIATSPGILVGLGLFTDGAALSTFETYLTAGVKTTDRTGRSRYNQLIAGYVSELHGESWTGTYKIEPGEFFYIKIRGNLQFQYQLQDRRLTVIPSVDLLGAKDVV